MSTWNMPPGVTTNDIPGNEPASRLLLVEFEVWQGDDLCASTSGLREEALREAMHYAAQYAQDGKVRVFEVTRKLVLLDGAGPAA